MEDWEIERTFYQVLGTAKEIIIKLLGFAKIVIGYVKEGMAEIYKGEKFE